MILNPFDEKIVKNEEWMQQLRIKVGFRTKIATFSAHDATSQINRALFTQSFQFRKIDSVNTMKRHPWIKTTDIHHTDLNNIEYVTSFAVHHILPERSPDFTNVIKWFCKMGVFILWCSNDTHRGNYIIVLLCFLISIDSVVFHMPRMLLIQIMPLTGLMLS